MIDIEEATNNLVEEMLEWIDTCPIDLTDWMPHDVLYDTCYQHIIDTLAAKAEDERDEAKYEGYDEQD